MQIFWRRLVKKQIKMNYSAQHHCHSCITCPPNIVVDSKFNNTTSFISALQSQNDGHCSCLNPDKRWMSFQGAWISDWLAPVDCYSSKAIMQWYWIKWNAARLGASGGTFMVPFCGLLMEVKLQKRLATTSIITMVLLVTVLQALLVHSCAAVPVNEYQSSCYQTAPTMCGGTDGTVYMNITSSCVLCPDEVLNVTCYNADQGLAYLFKNNMTIASEEFADGDWKLFSEVLYLKTYSHNVTMDDQNMKLTCHCGSSPNNLMDNYVTFHVIDHVPEPINVTVTYSSDYAMINWKAQSFPYDKDKKPSGYIITIGDKEEFTTATSYVLSLPELFSSLNVSVKVLCGKLYSSSATIKIPEPAETLSSAAISTLLSPTIDSTMIFFSSDFPPGVPTSLSRSTAQSDDLFSSMSNVIMPSNSNSPPNGPQRILYIVIPMVVVLLIVVVFMIIIAICCWRKYRHHKESLAIQQIPSLLQCCQKRLPKSDSTELKNMDAT